MISYRLPSIPELFGMEMSVFDTYPMLTFEIKVKIPVEGQDEMETLSCNTGSTDLCTVRYKKTVTPIIYYLNPPVVY
jgi:hypothetical protein